jgi:hypothetical protein
MLTASLNNKRKESSWYGPDILPPPIRFMEKYKNEKELNMPNINT